jgi:thioredoxin reductase
VITADSQFTVTTTAGNRYHADKILVAAGSFVNHFNLLPQKLALRSKSEVVLLV